MTILLRSIFWDTLYFSKRADTVITLPPPPETFQFLIGDLHILKCDTVCQTMFVSLSDFVS